MLLATWNVDAAHDNPTRVRLLQEVDAAQQGGLARTRGAHDDDDFAAAYRQVYATQHFQSTEALAHPLEAYLVHQYALASRRSSAAWPSDSAEFSSQYTAATMTNISM